MRRQGFRKNCWRKNGKMIFQEKTSSLAFDKNNIFILKGVI